MCPANIETSEQVPAVMINFEVGAKKEIFTISRRKLESQSKYFAEILHDTSQGVTVTFSVPGGCPDACRLFRRGFCFCDYDASVGLIKQGDLNPGHLRPLMSLAFMASKYEAQDLWIEAGENMKPIIFNLYALVDPDVDYWKALLRFLSEIDAEPTDIHVEKLRKEMRVWISQGLGALSTSVVSHLSEEGLLPDGMLGEVMTSMKRDTNSFHRGEERDERGWSTETADLVNFLRKNIRRLKYEKEDIEKYANKLRVEHNRNRLEVGCACNKRDGGKHEDDGSDNVDDVNEGDEAGRAV